MFRGNIFSIITQMGKTLESYLRYERAQALDIDQLKRMVSRSGLRFVDWVNFRGHTLHQLLQNSTGAVLLLDHKGADVGHYVLFHKVGNHVEYFDSYGLAPDRLVSILQFDDKDTHRYLNIVKDTKKHYHRLQERRADINTCGRYAVMRYNVGFFSYEQFVSMLHHGSLHPDDVVTMLTMSPDLAHWKGH